MSTESLKIRPLCGGYKYNPRQTEVQRGKEVLNMEKMLKEEKQVKCATSKNEINANVSNKIIKTALVNQINTALQWIDDAVSLLLKGDFACKNNLKAMLEVVSVA